MSKLQEFLSLGDQYAADGGYLEKKSDAYLDDFKKNAGYNNYTKFARDVNNWAARMPGTALVCGISVLEISKNPWNYQSTADHGRRILQLCIYYKLGKEKWHMAQHSKGRSIGNLPERLSCWKRPELQ